MERIFEEIKRERRRQDRQWGGPEHDDDHTSLDWVRFIAKQLNKIDDWSYVGDRSSYYGLFRSIMVRVAALAVAAIEWADRQYTPEELGEESDKIHTRE